MPLEATEFDYEVKNYSTMLPSLDTKTLPLLGFYTKDDLCYKARTTIETPFELTDFHHQESKDIDKRTLPKQWRKYLPKALKFHMHDYCQITYLNIGKCLYFINNKQVEVSKGDILIINEKTVHSWLAIEDTRNTYISFRSNTILLDKYLCKYEKVIRLLYSAQFSYFHIKPDSSNYSIIKNSICTIIDEDKKRMPGFSLVIHNQVILITLTLLRMQFDLKSETPVASNYPNTISNALLYIEKNISTIKSITEVANIVHLNPSYFSHLFKRTLGISCQRFINNERLSRAAELLRTTEKEIAYVAFESGFSSLSSFYRLFTSMHSVSPSKYRSITRDK